MPTSPTTPDAPATNPAVMKPGDEAMAGSPGTGEDLCEECGGTGLRKDGTRCPNCEGTGRVTRAIGGA